MKLNPGLIFMQDSALGYATQATLDELNDRQITFIYWPLYSPNLNPIKAVQNQIKSYIKDKWRADAKLSYNKLREAVKKAQNKVLETFFNNLIDSMPARCQAIINTQGGFTKY